MTNEIVPPYEPNGAAGLGSPGQRAGARLMKFAEVEPWPEPVDGQLLLEELAGVLARYVVLPPNGAEALALWSLHTYAFHLRDVVSVVSRPLRPRELVAHGVEIRDGLKERTRTRTAQLSRYPWERLY